MKLTPILLIPLLFLSSCTIDWNDEKDKKITELNTKIEEWKEEIKKVKDDELFKKNKECFNLKDNIEKSAKTADNFIRVQTIFYSPIIKSCIWELIYQSYDKATFEKIPWDYWSILQNLFSNEGLMNSKWDWLDGYLPKTNSIEDEIKYLKNETN